MHMRHARASVDGRTDDELLEQWRAGQVEAGHVLFERHFALVERFFVTKVGLAADDLIQATFAACVHGRDRIRQAGYFRGYLLGIARHELIAHFVRQRKVCGDIELQEELSAMRDGGASPSSLAAGKEEQRALLGALRSLRLDQQIVLELHYWEDLSMAEIAEVLGVPAGTVKSRLRLAREALKSKLREDATQSYVAEATITNLDAWAHSLRNVVSPRTP